MPLESTYEPAFANAVAEFWRRRSQQSQDKIERGTVDAGTRGAVTGGGHLGAVEKLVEQVFVDAGIPRHNIHLDAPALPGYHRYTKQWDIVVIHKGLLVATVELKSQVGSFGNNQNNRIEEALGQAVDHRTAAREGLLTGIDPWFGYIMILESSPRSHAPVGLRGTPLLTPDNAFDGLSYTDRYVEAFRRMRTEKHLDAACLATSEKDSLTSDFPSRELSFDHFAMLIDNRVRQVLDVL